MGASFQEHFELGGTAQAAVGTSAAALPANPAKLVRVRADPGNTGSVYVGPAGVTVATGYILTNAGDETPWLPVSDVSDLEAIADNAGENVSIIWLT